MRTLASLAIFLLAFASARADQLITNGGFESGLTGWTAASNGDGNFTANSGTTTPLTFSDTVGAHSGTFYAVSDDFDGSQTQTLTQSFTTPTSFTSAILSFDMFVNDIEGSAFGSSGAGGEVSLLTSTGALIAVLNGPVDTFESPMGSPNPYLFYSDDITALLNANTTYELQFSSADSTGLINVGVDDVSIVTAAATSPVPEPATFSLFAIGGVLVFWLACGKSKAVKNPLLLTVCLVLSSALAYGQAMTVPVVSPGSVGPGEARPYTWVVVPVDDSSTVNIVRGPGQACSTANPCYYFPSDLWTAYGLPPLQARGHDGQGITIGIVDAYYDPTIASNLQAFSTDFHLPLGSSSSITCSTTPTFTVVSQTGGSPSGVSFDAGWAVEANLDVQNAHAMAPCANILLIAANSNSFDDLGVGVQYAYAHADLVSNSYGADEFSGETSFDSLYSGSPVPILFSSGDAGAVTEYPCTSIYTTCVGGTSLLTTAASFRTAESAWFNSGGGGTGGGCSSEVGEPSYQTSFTNPICGTARGVPDVAALADPYTGVTLYVSSNVGYGSTGLYCCFGGTSLAAPLTTGVLANVDNARVTAGKSKLGPGLNTLLYQAARYSPTGISSQPAPYGSSYRSFYFDVYTGNSGFPATTYWDRTTGLGVPAFASVGNYLITTVP